MPLVSARNKSTDEYWDAIYGKKEESTPTPAMPSGAQEDPATSPDPEGDGNFMRGLKAGVANTQALAGGAKAFYGSVGDDEGSIQRNDEFVREGMEYYQRKTKEAEQYRPDVNFKDIDSITDFGAWSAYTLGSAVPDLAGMVLGAGAGGLLAKQAVKHGVESMAEKMAQQATERLVKEGVEKATAQRASKEVAEKFAKDKTAQYATAGATAGGVLYGTQSGTSSTFARTLDETNVEAKLPALAAGTVIGALNAVPAFKVLQNIIPKGKSDDAVEFISGELADISPWKKEFLNDVFKQAGVEGVTEALQLITEEETISWVNNNMSDLEKREYFDYYSNVKKRDALIEAGAAGFLFGGVTGAAGATVKAKTGGYDPISMGDDAKVIRTQSVNDPDFGAGIARMFDEAKSNAESGQTSIDIDIDDSFLNENAPLTPEQRTEAGLSELTDYDGTQIDMPEGDAPADPSQSVAVVTEQENEDVAPQESEQQTSGFGENTLPPSPQSPQADIVNDFPAATAFGSTPVPQGQGNYGPAHRFDGELSPADTSAQEQLFQLSVKAQSTEALDPDNTEVIVEAIDQDDVDRIIDRNESLTIGTTDKPKGKSLPTIDEVYGAESTEVTNVVAGVLSDLSAAGVPKSFIDSVSGVFVHNDSDVDAPAMTGQKTQGISINESLVAGARNNEDSLSELAWSMTHEVYHAADFSMGLSDKDPSFNIMIDEDANGPSVVMGDIMNELFVNWKDGTDLGKRFDYPFNDLNKDISDLTLDNEGLNTTYRQEVFAQLGALFHSNPKQLQENAPLAYDYIKNIRDNNLKTVKPVEEANEPTVSASTPDTSQPTGISGQVRAPPESGSEQVVQPKPARPDGEGSAGEGRADTPVEGQIQQEVGERERPEIQEPEVAPAPEAATSIEASDPDRTPIVLKATDKKPTFKKAINWEDTGEYIVTFADGDRYTVYFDDSAKEAGDEVYFTSEDGKVSALDGMLGETKQETIDGLIAHRQKLIDAGENSYNLPLNPDVGSDIQFKAWDFIQDNGAVTEKRLRTKFKSLEDNQFENIKEYLLSEKDDAEDVVVFEDGKFLSYEYVQESDLDDLQQLFDDPSFIKKGSEYLLQKSNGPVGEKNTLPVTKITPTTKDPSGEVKRMTDVVAKHPEALSSPEAWLAFERDLTGTNETLAPPYGLIRLYNDIDSWVSLHSSLTPEQLDAADRGLATTKRMKELYASGQATPTATAKLMLWGLMSRRQTASGQEAGFVDLMTGSTAVSDLAQKALDGDVSDADVKAWTKLATKLIPDGSFGRSAISNANDFGRLMQKLAEPHDENITKLQRLHDLMASDLPTKEVRHEFQMLVQGSGIDNKVFSFNMLMIGRDDVVILDRIQLNSMWDSERYGKNIYADIADEFSGLRGLARYEAIETSLQNKIKDFYKKLGRSEDASVGRYHWESWVRDSGQVVAHPTMQGLEKDVKGEKSPYAFIGAPEGKMNTYAYSAIYGRDNEGTPYYVYPDSKGTFHRFNLDKWEAFKKEIKKPKNGIVDKSFKVSDFDKGTPWYESDQVNRQKLDELVESYAERKAVEREYASERAVTSDATDVAGLADRRKQVYRSLRSAATPDSGSSRTQGNTPRRFRRKTGKPSQVLVAGQKVSGYKRELETSAKAALQEVESFNGTVIELASNKTNAKLFASKIQAGKDANPFGASVYVYPESDYQNMKMFMTEDGSAGIAIENGDTIVSLYNNGTHKKVTYSLASIAVEEGGLYSDAFDTQLPYLYQDVGFKVISRLKWSDQFAPNDWDKDQFQDFNKGEPDVVFMVVDPDYFGPYSKDVGYYVDTYEEGMRSIRETRRPEQERISPKLKQAVQDRIDRNISAAELNDIFRKEGRYVKPMHPDMIAPLKPDSHYINALKKTNREKPNTPSKETYWLSNSLVDGQRTGSRLDIPAHSAKALSKEERADVVTAHAARPRRGDAPFAGAAGTRLGYYPTLRLDNALFASPQKGATNIAMGAEKNTIATIEGNYVAVDHEQNRLDFIAAMDDPAWTQISMNPERHTFFYDLATQTPVKSASQVIQVGNLVIAKDVVYDDVESFSYIKKKQVNKETNTLDDGSPSTSQFTYNDEIDAQSDTYRRMKSSKVYKSLVDKYAQLEDFEQQAAEYLEVGRLPAPISPRDQENLMHGKVQEDLNAFHKNFVDPLGDMIAAAGVDVDAVGLYLLAKHAPERNAAIAERVKAQREKNIATTEREINRLLDDVGVDHTVALATQRKKLEDYQTLPLAFEGTGSGMTSEQSQAILVTAEREGTADDMEAIAGKVYEMLDYQRNLMVEYGLMDELSVEDWLSRYKFYVPLKGFYDESDQDQFKKGIGAKGFSIVGSESMKAKGRKTLPANPLLNAIEDVQKKIIRARKNEASQTLLTLLSELGDSQSYNIYNNKYRPMMDSDPLTMQDMKQMSMDRRVNGDPKYIQVKKGGQTFFIEFKSDTLNAAMQDMSVAALNNSNDAMNAVLRGLTRFQTFRRNMLINYNPSWGLVNPIRDLQTALMYTLAEQDKKGSRVNGENVIGAMAQDYFPAMRSLYRFYREKPARDGNEMDRYAAEFHEDGAATGLVLLKDQDEQLRILQNKLKRGYTREALTAIGKFVEDFNTTMENSVRLSVYVQARKSGADRGTGATLSKDVTVNFNRKGESTAQVNAMYLFFNAAVQGNVNMAQALASGEAGGRKKKVTNARLAAGGLVAMGAAMALMNMWNSEEDDDGELKYQDLPEHAKNRVQLFMYGSEEGFALPMAYGLNFFTNIGRLGAEMANGVTSQEDAAVALWENFLLNFVPIAPSSGDNWEEKMRGFYPDLLELHQDMLANKNYFGSQIYIEQNPLFVAKSKAYVSRRSTPDIYKDLAEFMNDATGGDTYKDGDIFGMNTAFNPEKMEYIFEYLTGGVGRFGMQTFDAGGKIMEGRADEIEKRKIPIVGTFFKQTSEYEDRFEFYDNWEATRQIVYRFKDAEGDPEELKRLRNEYQHYAPLLDRGYGFGKKAKSLYEIANRDLRAISRTRKIVEKQNIDEDRRKEMIDTLDINERKIFDIYNTAFREAKERSE